MIIVHVFITLNIKCDFSIFDCRFRVHLYMIWNLTFSLAMLVLTPVWYNFFIAHCVILVIFIILAIFNGATYYIDVFSLEGIGKNKTPPAEIPLEDVKKNSAPKYGTIVSCTSGGSEVATKTVLRAWVCVWCPLRLLQPHVIRSSQLCILDKKHTKMLLWSHHHYHSINSIKSRYQS